MSLNCKLYWQLKAKSGIRLIVLKTNLLFLIISGCISFIEVSANFFDACTKAQKCHLLRLVACYAGLTGRKCQKMLFRLTCFDYQIQNLSKRPAVFPTSGSSTILHLWSIIQKCLFLETFRKFVSLKTEITSKCIVFFYFCSLFVLQTFCSPELLAEFCPTGYEFIFSSLVKLLDCQIMHLVLGYEKLMAQTNQKLNIGLIRPVIIQTRFLSKQLSGLFPPRSQSIFLFLVQVASISIFLSFLEKIYRPKLPKYMYLNAASLC